MIGTRRCSLVEPGGGGRTVPKSIRLGNPAGFGSSRGALEQPDGLGRWRQGRRPRTKLLARSAPVPKMTQQPDWLRAWQASAAAAAQQSLLWLLHSSLRRPSALPARPAAAAIGFWSRRRAQRLRRDTTACLLRAGGGSTQPHAATGRRRRMLQRRAPAASRWVLRRGAPAPHVGREHLLPGLRARACSCSRQCAGSRTAALVRPRSCCPLWCRTGSLPRACMLHARGAALEQGPVQPADLRGGGSRLQQAWPSHGLCHRHERAECAQARPAAGRMGHLARPRSPAETCRVRPTCTQYPKP